MLLPEPVRDRSVFEGRPLWSMVEAGVARSRACEASRLADLDGCSVVIARRRHQAWHGPVAGFRVAEDLRRAWLVELFGIDVCPWADEDAKSVFDWGVASVLEYARLFGRGPPRRLDGLRPALDGIIVPEGLGGVQVRQWLDSHPGRLPRP